MSLALRLLARMRYSAMTPRWCLGTISRYGDYLSKWIECVNSTAFSAGYSGLDLNGRWLSTVNRFSRAPTISLADSESLPSSRLTFCWAQVFHVGCDRPNNRNRSLTSPSGHPRTGPVLALRPSNLP